MPVTLPVSITCRALHSVILFMRNLVFSFQPRSGRDLPRWVYLIITIGCIITAVSLYFSGYHGYSGLVVAIGLAAAINLKN